MMAGVPKFMCKSADRVPLTYIKLLPRQRRILLRSEGCSGARMRHASFYPRRGGGSAGGGGFGGGCYGNQGCNYDQYGQMICSQNPYQYQYRY